MKPALMPQTGFIVRVPQAEARVADLRERFDASAALGVPAHITLLIPFMAPEAIDSAVLQGIRETLAGVCAFDFVLASAARFPATAWLAPEPAAPFIDLTDRLVRRFPAYPPFGGEFEAVIPHLTVAHGDAALAELARAELLQRLAAHGVIHGRCDAVVLLENASGRWREMHAFALA
jgi:2'-5' RNA ligase